MKLSAPQRRPPFSVSASGFFVRGDFESQALRLARSASTAVLAGALAVFCVACLDLPRAPLGLLLPFLVLTLLAALLRVPSGHTHVGLEAAAVLPAVVLVGSWQAGVVLVAIASLLARAIERRGLPRREDLDDTADLVLAYAAAGFFSVSVGTVSTADGQVARSLIFASGALVFFFARLILTAVRAAGGPEGRLPELVRVVLYQLVALVLLAPCMALILLLHPLYGIPGDVLAFTSFALFSAALRSFASARRRAAELFRRNRELATLRALSRLFTSNDRDEVVFERLFGTLREVLPVKALATVSFEEEPDPLRGTEVEKVTAVLSGETRLPRADLLAWVTKTADPNGLHEAPARQLAAGSERTIVLNAAFPYQVVLPLQTPEVITGLLVLESDDAALHEPELVQQLTQLADHVALSVQDRSLRRQMQAVNERLQSRAEALHRILDVSNELKSHLTLDHVIQNIVRAASASLGWDVVLLSLYDRAENVFVRRAHVGLDEAWDSLSKENLPREEVVKWFAERHRISKSYFISHVEQQLSPEDSSARAARRRKGLAAPWHARDLFFVPLTAGDQIIGVLQIDQPRSGFAPRLEDIQALEIFANQAVTAIQSARAYETTRQLSVRDSLTEAFNHRHFQETLYREITRHERNRQPLALLMVDIDDFKKINDKFGHPVGDLVLRGLVEELRRGVREMDTVARYGGEEFALILPETPEDRALVVAERLRQRIAARLFVTPELSHPLSVTVSMGLATYPDDASNKRLLVERADQALYKAKRNGKNCVVRAPDLSIADAS